MVQETSFIDAIDMRGVRQPARQSSLGRDVDEDAQIGIGVLHGERLNPFEVDEREMISAPLVGKSGVDEPVGDDDIAAIDRRRDELGDMLGTSGTMQQRFGSWLEVAQIAVEKKSPDGFANGRSAGLSGQDDGPAGGADAIGQLSRLRRLAGTVDSFECYEFPTPHLERSFAEKLHAPVWLLTLAARADVVPVG